MSDKIVLELKNITKVFPGVKALDNVRFDLREGEVQGPTQSSKAMIIKLLVALALGIFRVHAHLVGAAVQDPVEVLQARDTPARHERDVDALRDPAQELDEDRPALPAGGDVVEHQLVHLVFVFCSALSRTPQRQACTIL